MDNTTNIKRYSLDGQFLGDISFFDLLSKPNGKKSKSVKEFNINNALNTYKGYGFYNDELISLNEIVLLTPEQDMRMFDKWCRINLQQTKEHISRINNGELDEDVFSDVLALLCESIHNGKCINDINTFIMFKYVSTKTDHFRKKKTKKSKMFVRFSDLILVDDEEYDDLSIIESMAADILIEETAQDVCTMEVNQQKKYEIIEMILRELFEEKKLNIYLEYKTTETSYVKLGKKHGYCKDSIRKFIKQIDDVVMNKPEVKKKILELYNDVKYPTLDELTLTNIIHD